MRSRMAFVDRREQVLLGACSWVGACRAAAAVALRSGRHEPPGRCGVVDHPCARSKNNRRRLGTLYSHTAAFLIRLLGFGLLSDP
jgi:hypothetical protein